MDRESSWPLDWAKSRKDSAVSSTASLTAKSDSFSGDSSSSMRESVTVVLRKQKKSLTSSLFPLL